MKGIDRDALAQELDRALGSGPARARELVQRLREREIEADRSTVNSILYAGRGRYLNDGATPPTWRLAARTPAADEPRGKRRRAKRPNAAAVPTDQPLLYRWQQQALDAWGEQGRQGVVEAVTGTGKTMVGMAAAQQALNEGHQVLVLVPTKELLHQWAGALRKQIPTAAVGLLGDGKKQALRQVDILVAIINGARNAPSLIAPRSDGLLVADECHRYGTEKSSKAFLAAFSSRLGLSATYAREDDGNAEYLDPYFGDTCYSILYEQAIAEEVTAHFKVALVGVEFGEPGEAKEYEEAAEKASRARTWLVNNRWAVEEPFGEYMKDVAELSKGHKGKQRRRGRGDAGHAVKTAQRFMSGFTRQRTLLAETSSKLDALDGLRPAFEQAGRSFVFTMTKEAAEAAAEHLEAMGLRAAFIHSGQKTAERKDLLARFKNGEFDVIAAAKVLDEGVDVPEADFAVILSTSKTRRQMVQRMGRVLRRKADGRLARFVVVYVEHTAEDPDRGAHLGFTEEVTEVAEDYHQFRWDDSEWEEVNDFLNDFRVSGGQPGPVWADD